MNYVCAKQKCSVRQPVKEDVSAIPKCDCGEQMVPDVSAQDDRTAAKMGIYRRY